MHFGFVKGFLSTGSKISRNRPDGGSGFARIDVALDHPAGDSYC